MKKEEKEGEILCNQDSLIIFLDDDDEKKSWWIQGYKQNSLLTFFYFQGADYTIPNNRIFKIKTPK